MARKAPKVRMLKPLLKAADFRTVPVKPQTFANRVAADPLLRFYQGQEWRELRAAVIRERGTRCEACGTDTPNPIVDHRQEIRDGGARLDRGNLLVTCRSCHQTKTYQARAERYGLA
jgi:5-methylcytosine-specific restriction enzyme A